MKTLLLTPPATALIPEVLTVVDAVRASAVNNAMAMVTIVNNSAATRQINFCFDMFVLDCFQDVKGSSPWVPRFRLQKLNMVTLLRHHRLQPRGVSTFAAKLVLSRSLLRVTVSGEGAQPLEDP